MAVAVGAFLAAAAEAMAQPAGAVRGRVVDAATQRPLSGAQVVVVGLDRGAMSNAAGDFVIVGVPQGPQRIRVQMIGFATAEQTVTVRDGEPVAVNFQLSQTAIALDEIVVTGTAGAVQRRAIGNVVTTIDASRVTEMAPIPDVAMLLNARAPGVVVMPASGMVGAGARVRIRGAASFSLNDQPLIYVDGVRMNNAVSTGPTVQGFGSSPITRLSDINPDDIESIEVIKGPAAATLYGTEAANGVIQIITRRGAAGDRAQIGVTVRQGATWFANAERRINPAVYRDPATGEVREMNLVRLERERGTPIWTTGHLQGFGLDVSGGSDVFRYFVSTNYDADNGIEPTNKLRRLSGRMNLQFTPFNALDVSTNLGLVTSTTDLARENGGTWFGARLGSPAFLDTPNRGFWNRPPEITWAAHRDFQEVRRFMAGVQVNHRPAPWLSHRLNLGLDITGENNQSITERMDEEMAQFYTPTAALGSKTVERRDVTYSTVDYAATATLPLSSALTSSTSAGLQYYRDLTQIAVATGREFPAPGLRTIEATAVTFGSDDYVENATVGVYLQQQFAWRNRLFITGAVRADDNSAFGERFTLVTYPKFSASWVVNEEPFWNVDMVDALRLRFAYGASGQQPETFAALRTYAPITTGSGAAALTPRYIGNPYLAPERGEEIELGFETSFFNERFGIDFTFYSQRTRDAILMREQPPSLGFPRAQFVNVGEIRNRGIEVQLRALAYRSEQANLDLAFNVSTNANRVVDLGGDESIVLGHMEHRVGFPVASWFERRLVSAELDAQGRAINLMCDGGPEANHAPVPCADAPRVFLGRSQPNIEGAFNPTLTLFNRLTLYALFDFKLGHMKDDTERQARCSTRQICRENVFPAQYPLIIGEIQNVWLFNTNLRMHDASFAKFREVAASYTLPARWANSFGASRASVRLAARNLYTWTNWQGLDPEAFRLNQLHHRAEQEAMPQLAQFQTTINLTF
jgi:TonB-linked SusC/RagA family outer membrane protein